MKDKKRIAIIILRRANALICHDTSVCALDLAALLLCPGARRRKKEGKKNGHLWEIRVYSAATD